MIRVLVLAVVVGAVVVVVASGRVDDLRSQIGLRENPFDAVNEALKDPGSQRARQKIAWGALARKANSICTDYEADELVIRLTIPRNRADYVEALGIVIERERLRQAELAALKPPANYRVAYARFLEDRRVALAALKRLRTAAKEDNRKDLVVAARAIARAQLAINPYVRRAGMPACAI